MTQYAKTTADKKKIISHMAVLNKLLGMIPADETVTVKEPLTEKTMKLSEWLEDSRKAFFELSVELDKTLELNIQ